MLLKAGYEALPQELHQPWELGSANRTLFHAHQPPCSHGTRECLEGPRVLERTYLNDFITLSCLGWLGPRGLVPLPKDAQLVPCPWLWGQEAGKKGSVSPVHCLLPVQGGRARVGRGHLPFMVCRSEVSHSE